MQAETTIDRSEALGTARSGISDGSRTSSAISDLMIVDIEGSKCRMSVCLNRQCKYAVLDSSRNEQSTGILGVSPHM